MSIRRKKANEPDFVNERTSSPKGFSLIIKKYNHEFPRGIRKAKRENELWNFANLFIYNKYNRLKEIWLENVWPLVNKRN